MALKYYSCLKEWLDGDLFILLPNLLVYVKVCLCVCGLAFDLRVGAQWSFSISPCVLMVSFAISTAVFLVVWLLNDASPYNFLSTISSLSFFILSLSPSHTPSLSFFHSTAFCCLSRIDVCVCVSDCKIKSSNAVASDGEKKTELRYIFRGTIEIHTPDEWERTCYTLLIWQTVDKWERW